MTLRRNIAAAGIPGPSRMAPPANRIDAIDFGKGTLVLLMVVYHALNYLGYDTIPHQFMAFLPASFIMVAGFLVMQVYSTKEARDRGGVPRRLAIRAMKLLLIFTVLNLGARAIWSRNHYGAELNFQEFISRWFEIFVTGQGRDVAFGVLVPISYTLMLSICVLKMREVSASSPMLLAVGSFVLCASLDLAGHAINNLFFISSGIIGLWLGTLELSDIDRAATSWKFPVAFISVFIGMTWLAPDNYVSQIFLTVTSVFLFYALGRTLPSGRWWNRQVCLLGRYSLMSYIVQILLLQATKVLDPLVPHDAVAQAAFLIVLISVFMWMIVKIVDYGRSKMRVADRLYRGVFA